MPIQEQQRHPIVKDKQIEPECQKDVPSVFEAFPIRDEQKEYVQHVVKCKVDSVRDKDQEGPCDYCFLCCSEFTSCLGEKLLLLSEEVDEVEPEHKV